MDDKKITLKLNNRKQTIFGIISFSMGILSCITFLVAVFISAFGNLESYNTKMLIGYIELCSIILTITGLVFGYVGERTEDTLKTFAHIGIGINIVFLIIHVIVLLNAY